VLQIVKEDGTVVNQYDYDAFGRVRWDSENTYENGVENRYLFQGREWDKNGGFYYFRNRIYLPERGEFATPDMNLGRGILGELDGMATLTFCGGDPVNCIDPTGLSVLSWMLGYGFSGGEATAFEQGFAEGYDGGSCIAANALTFGQIDSLKTRSERLVAEDDMYRTSQGLANFGNSMFMASGGTVLLKGGMVGLGVLAAKGGAIGTAATVTQVSAGCGLTVLAAKSAGDNLGTAAGEIDAGKYGWATFHASLGLLDIYSAGASSYGGYKTLSQKVVASSPKPDVNSTSSPAGVTKSGGRLGNNRTRAHIDDVATEMETRDWVITRGGQRGLPEEYLPGPGGARKGSSYLDITATKNGRTLRVNTVDTYTDGITPTTREAVNAARIRGQTPGEHLLLVPKPKPKGE